MESRFVSRQVKDPSKSVGVLLRSIHIDSDIRNCLNDILRAPSYDSPEVESARAALFDLAAQRSHYSCAVQVRAYLEEKTQVGSEPWAYPTAGDLFVDGLEADLDGLGPNLFRDRCSAALACYKAGCDATRTLQAPFYCLDLLLRRTISLFLHRTEADRQAKEAGTHFMAGSAPGYRGQVREFEGLADEMLSQGTELLLTKSKAIADRSLADHLMTACGTARTVLRRWWTVLGSLEQTTDADEACVRHMHESIRPLAYVPLDAFLREQLAHFARSAEPEGEMHVQHAYEAGEAWMALGNVEREAGAHTLACRRYERAVAAFGSIHDRTSQAKALVEQARAYLRRGGDRPLLAARLRDAVRLVYAHKHRLPPGQLPQVPDHIVYQFLSVKGYTEEAEAFRNSLGKQVP